MHNAYKYSCVDIHVHHTGLKPTRGDDAPLKKHRITINPISDIKNLFFYSCSPNNIDLLMEPIVVSFIS